MGLLSMFGASPETQEKFSKGLLAVEMSFPHLRRLRMEEDQATSEAEWKKRQREMQEAQYKQQMLEREQALAKQQGIEGAYRGAIESPATQALANGQGPTVGNAQSMLGMKPRINTDKLVSGLLPHDPVSAYQMLQPKPADYKVVGDSLVEIGGGGVKEAYRAPVKPPAPPSSVQEFEYGQKNPQFNEWDLGRKKATASSVIVGTGKVGELETSYRKEFNTLPEVVRFKSAIPAFKAVEGAATRPGTQSEINLIYGLAKLYDPESVVREGEYDTIANSQSIPEWLKGQAQRLAGGGKLTPETKRQILIEARARKAALEDEYNGAQKTYEAIAKRQGLDPQNVFTPIGGYSTPNSAKPKSRLVQIDGGGNVSATLGEDGNYYVKRGGKTYRVEE